MTRFMATIGISFGACVVALAAERPVSTPWSLKPVVRPAVPKISLSGPIQTNPIDAFIRHSLAARGLSPAPPADRAALIRRLTFDLIGLPPTPDEIDQFVNDSAPDAHERLVDRLLASPRYGERWGRHWLDVARFAESQGFERDKIRDHAWRYRDYVIRSFNADKPYDRFVREQVAGDVLPNAGVDGVVATGFLVAGPWDEAGSGSVSALLRARIREEELEDMIGAVGQTFLGMTVNCARCHDHKFDPIPQRDYYRIKSVFDGVRHGDRPVLPIEMQRQRSEQLAALDREIADAEGKRLKLESAARAKVVGRQVPKSIGDVPLPISRWTFDVDARDDVGKLHGAIRGSAQVANGRLVLRGDNSFVETVPTTADLTEKTLETWVVLRDRKQRGGGVISVQTLDGGQFDAIVFGERQPGKWMAGSEGFRRTRDHDGQVESSKLDDLIHIAVVYAKDGKISVYRNGTRYFETYHPSGEPAKPASYAAGTSQVLFGLRHRGAGNGFLRGEIEEARLYDRALSTAQVEASFRAGPAMITRAELMAAMTDAERMLWQGYDKQIATLRMKREAMKPSDLAYAANSKPSEPTHVLLRGDVEKKGERVAAGGLSSARGLSDDLGLTSDAPEGERRIRFANWLADPANPLTARVMVNRIWHYHFGRGIVDTPNDFGANGSPPSHPELLDWLASEFIARGWSIKAMHRLILNSATYRQGSRFDENAAKVDADNHLIWRFAPRRLEAEAVRDAMLAISGRLSSNMGGPSFQPFKIKVFNSTFYDLIDEDKPEFNRRTVYRIGVNSAKDPLLESFDCPEPSVKAPRRNITTTPIQALGLMNNPFVIRQARIMAERVQSNVEAAYRLALGRSPSEPEANRAKNLVREHGMESLCWALLNSSEFLYVK